MLTSRLDRGRKFIHSLLKRKDKEKSISPHKSVPTMEDNFKVETSVTEGICRPVLCAFDFDSSEAEELSFCQGDILLLDGAASEKMFSSANQWIRARDWRNDKVGVVPTKLLTDELGISRAFDAFNCILRKDAEDQLLLPVIQSGTFILRPGSAPATLALSVLVKNQSKAIVQHYHLKYDSSDKSYFICANEKFASLDELIKFYSTNQSEYLPLQLGSPYLKLSQTSEELGDCVVSRDSIQMKRILGQGAFGEIWLATYRGNEVAVKCTKTTTKRKVFVEEAHTMYQLNHPRLVRFLGICCEPISKPILLILEYMPNGALDDYLRKNKPAYEKLLNILLQVGEKYPKQQR